MGWFSDDHEDAYNEFQATPHKAALSHELIAGAAAFEAAKAYEDHRARNGNPDNHALAKEVLAGFAGAAVDRLVETKGLDALDSYQRQRAVDHVQERLRSGLASQYGAPQNDVYQNDVYQNDVS